MEFIAVKNWHDVKICEKVKTRLEKRGFEAVILNDRRGVEAFIDERIPVDKTVGLGGSVTLRELGIDSYLKKKGNTVYDHWEDGLSKEAIQAIIKNHPRSDVFLTSINSVTLDGQLVNIDGTGNRVASMIFGPGQVIAFVGVNKISKNLDEALWKIRNYSCPRNSKRKNMGAPCETTGVCVECKDPSSTICKITTIIDFKPPTMKFTVALLPESLGL